MRNLIFNLFIAFGAMFFTAVTMLIALPTGTKIFNWVLTWILCHNMNGTNPLLIRTKTAYNYDFRSKEAVNKKEYN